MMKHVRSAFVLAGVGVGAVLAGYTGLIAEMWRHDNQWISTVTLVVAVVAYAASFFKVSIAAEAAPYCMKLGLFGTVVGFIVQLSSWTSQGFSDLSGSYTALYTTAVGMVCATILELHWSLRDEN